MAPGIHHAKRRRWQNLKQDVLEALSHPGKQSFQGQDLFSRNVRRENEQPPQDYQPPFGGSKNSTAMLTTFNEGGHDTHNGNTQAIQRCF